MLILAGTIPVKNMPLITGYAKLTLKGLTIDGHLIDLNRGTAAMITTVATVCDALGSKMPFCVVAGDIGKRDGSTKIYRYLEENIPEMNIKILTFHYIMPDILKHNRVIDAVKKKEKKPFLIADAGSMYVAKAAGFAHYYDIFTPDVGEVAFLADEKADHPAYTRGFIWHMDDQVEELAIRAYDWNNAAKILFVKGKTDYIFHDAKLIDQIDEPVVKELEPIGGTGDTITGTISALLYANGMKPIDACSIAARVNRIAGKRARPNPATQVGAIIRELPHAFQEISRSRGEEHMGSIFSLAA
ncbi:MAG: NAD(P)H-hydrate dehydratase [bacterium]